MRRNIAVISHGETAETQVNVTLPIAVVYVGVFVGNLNQRAIDTHCQPRHVFARNENFVIIHGAAGFCVDISNRFKSEEVFVQVVLRKTLTLRYRPPG